MSELSTGEAAAMDRGLSRAITLDWEKAAWIVLIAAVLVTRLWHLGDRAMSHDESLHTYYAWKLFHGEGYSHDPMMHGPLLYHATALSYLLFGVSDFTARLLGAVSGALLVASPLLIRRWLGRLGALAAGLMLVLSPTVMYYSRYIRHDIPVELFTVLMFISFIRYVQDREGRWIVLALVAAAGAITSAEMSYINGFVLLTFAALALAAERLGRRRADGLALVSSAMGLGLLTFALLAEGGVLGELPTEASSLHSAMQVSFMASGLLLIYGVTMSLHSRFLSEPEEEAIAVEGTVLADLTPDRYLARFAETSAVAQMLGAGAVLLIGGWLLRGFVATRAMDTGVAARIAELSPTVLLAVGAAFVAVALGGLLWRAVGAERVNVSLAALGALIAAACLLGASRVSEGGALAGGQLTTSDLVYGAILGALIAFYGFLGWALERFAERRLSLSLGLAPGNAMAVGIGLFLIIYVLLFTTFFTSPGDIGGFADSVRYWWEQHDVQRGGQPWYYYGLFAPMYEFLPFFTALVAMVVYAVLPRLRVGRGNDGTFENPSASAKLFVPMLIAWGAANFWMYSWAGEKMPWLLVHLVVPLALLGARLVGDALESVDRAALRGRGWQIAVLALLLFGVWMGWMVALSREAAVGPAVLGVIAFALVAGLLFLGRRYGATQTLIVTGLVVVGCLTLWTARVSYAANFVNDELATEYIVYAHGTPDDKDVYELLQKMQEYLGPDDPLTIGYDNEVSWPFTWYFREPDWYRAEYLADNPAAVRADHDVVLVGDPNYDDFHPYLRDRYEWKDYRRMWWPNEGYKGLTLDSIMEQITDPDLRRNWLRILLFREYVTDPRDPGSPAKSLDDWYHHANMRLYVSHDVLDRLGPLADELDFDNERTPQVSAVKSVPVEVAQRYTEADGVPIVSPKDVAVGPDGSLYVVDHGNARIVVFDPDGELQAAFGDIDLRDGEGASTAWGVGVAADGSVYVADTWQHRIVRFVDGELVDAWGVYGEHKQTPSEGLAEFFGPRDVAVDAEGNLWVTDTGNSRIVAFSPEGRALDSVGGEGVEPGQFREPVSVAVDPATGDFYVADLWNYRVQRFDSDWKPVAQWPVQDWEDNLAADDKAYIAVGPGSTVVVTDPVGKRVWIFDADGQVLATLDVLSDAEGLDKPIGVAVGPDGSIYVASHNSGSITRYRPPEALAARISGEAPQDGADATAAAPGKGTAAAPEDAEATGAEGATGEEAGGPEDGLGNDAGGEPADTAGGEPGDEGAAGGDGGSAAPVPVTAEHP